MLRVWQDGSGVPGLYAAAGGGCLCGACNKEAGVPMLRTVGEARLPALN